jgi:erythrin-vacuolar iron transport family protein
VHDDSGGSVPRGIITGVATFFGGSAHALPFLINDVGTALAIAYPVVGCELLAIAGSGGGSSRSP